MTSSPDNPAMPEAGSGSTLPMPPAMPPSDYPIASDGGVLSAVPQVERYVRARRDTNQKFVGWGLYFFLLSWVTFGIYPIIIFYRRLNRADVFRDRKLGYYTSLVNLTHQHAQNQGNTSVLPQLDDLHREITARFTGEHKPIRAGLSVFLSIITLGIYGYIAIYRDMKFWWQIQLTEQDFYEHLGITWTKLKIVRHPVTFQPIGDLNRSFWMHFLLAIVTFGIYGMIWDYRLHTDPERLFPESDSAEDGILASVRQLA